MIAREASATASRSGRHGGSDQRLKPAQREGIINAQSGPPAYYRAIRRTFIGQGFNSDTGERVGTALDVGVIGEDVEADGQTAIFSFDMVTSQQSLESALHISADLEARYAMFSGGAKFGFAEQTAIRSKCPVPMPTRYARS